MVNSRQKGAGFETKVCKLLKQITKRTWVRTPSSGGVATRTGNIALAGDVMCQNFKSKYVFELKKYKEYNIESLITKKGMVIKWLQQLEREKGKRKGVLIFSRNYGKIFVLAETDEEIPNTMRYKNYVFGLFDEVMPILLKEEIRK